MQARSLVQSAEIAAPALVELLITDPRVQRVYAAAWRDGFRGFGAALDALVRDDLKLPYSWLPGMLAKGFAAKALTDMTGQPHAVRVTAAELPPGRKSVERAGTHIRRDVEWYYRLKIKTPPDTVTALTQENASGGNSTSHSVIQNGVKRAADVLAIFELPPA